MDAVSSDLGLMQVRARAAYWQKRIQLEKKEARRRELEQQAWAELTYLVLHHGSLHVPRRLQEQQFVEARRKTASRPTKRATASARAAGGTRTSKRTD